MQKWMVRADWRPWKSMTSQGKAASIAGDIVSPASTRTVNATTTPR